MPRDFVDLSKRQQKRVLNQELRISKRIRLENPSVPCSIMNQQEPTNLNISQSIVPVSPNPAANDSGSNDSSQPESQPNASYSEIYQKCTLFSSDNDLNDNVENHTGRDCQSSLSQHLIEAFVKHNAPQSLINDILLALRKSGLTDLPKDARTFMNTPKTGEHSIHEIEGGKYIHFGLFKNVKRVVEKYNYTENTSLKLNINIDGLPLAKSSRSQCWPILGDILMEDINTDPFTIGIFHGFSKPKESGEFLKYFLEEYKELEVNGILINGKKYEIVLNCIICDAPAKAYVLNIVGHTGYFSCTKCVSEGDMFEGKVIFVRTNAALRSNNSFRNRLQPEHHHGSSAFESLKIDMITQFPLDYMHLILLGVTKKILNLWLFGNKEVRLTKSQINNLEESYIATKGYVISDFARKPRSLMSLAMWKATEYRLFLLCIGPVVLKDILSAKLYNHFLALVVAVRLLCENNITSEHIEYSKNLMNYYVKKFGIFFGYGHYTHNIHNLIHIVEDARNHGSLDKFSSFKYENKFTKFKNMLQNSRFPLQQLYNRISEEQAVDRPIKIEDYPKIFFKKNKIFKVQLSFTTLSLKFNENCCILKDEKIVLIDSFSKTVDDLICCGKFYVNGEHFFDVPCKSTLLGITRVNNRQLSKEVIMFSFQEISKKCLRLRVDESDFVVIPLLHH